MLGIYKIECNSINDVLKKGKGFFILLYLFVKYFKNKYITLVLYSRHVIICSSERRRKENGNEKTTVVERK